MSATPWIIAIASAALSASPGDVAKVPAFDQFVVIPLRVHVLTSKDLEMADCRITDADLSRSLAGINAIWSKAGISFGVESILREPASQVDRFRTMAELDGGQLGEMGLIPYLIPSASRAFDGLHVYVFRDLPFNSAYFSGLDASVVKEKPDLVRVEGGGDDPLARVAARGLGLALGLKNRPDEAGLLSNATNGIGLNEAEVGRARRVARTIPGALEVDAADRAAEQAFRKEDYARARQLWTWLSLVPGKGAAEFRRRLLELPSGHP